MKNACIGQKNFTVFEHENVFEHDPDSTAVEKCFPSTIFQWFEHQALSASSSPAERWVDLKLTKGRKAIRFSEYVGIVRAPDGTTIEILPKTGSVGKESEEESRCLLVEMIRCLYDFPSIEIGVAGVKIARLPLGEIFIRCFLKAVERIVSRGIKRAYVNIEENETVLRGRLAVGQHVRHNMGLLERFYVRFDRFSEDRPENRLLRTGLSAAARMASTSTTRESIRRLENLLNDVPSSVHPESDFRRVRTERGMEDYQEALRWTRLLLQKTSPVAKIGTFDAPSLLFPMNTLFEAYVSHYLPKQTRQGFRIHAQKRSKSLVRHLGAGMFWLQPDLLVMEICATRAVLDTKWKIVDSVKSRARGKYRLDQADFYQLLAYGSTYLERTGTMALIFPRTEIFSEPLPVFDYEPAGSLNLWVLPFCLASRRLILPESAAISEFFSLDVNRRA